jgi:4-oxalocrotonate tautomerase
MWEGRSVGQKKQLVETFTKEMSRITQCKESSIYVVIDEVKKENWGAGGRLCSEKYPD